MDWFQICSRLLLAALTINVVSMAQPVDVLVRNARIWSGNPQSPWASSLSVRDGRLVCVGECDGPAKETIDADGRLVTPGFIDSHVHFLDGGFNLGSVQLRDAATQDEFVRRIAAHAKTIPAGQWIQGGDWNHELWGGQLPSRDWIDAVTPNHPVWINRLDGHMGLANSLALRLARVTRETRDVAGGSIVRDSSGEPTGIFKDNAMGLIAQAIPEPKLEEKLTALDRAMTYVAERGVTSIHHMGSWDDLAVFEQARLTNKLRIRVYAATPLSSWERLRDRIQTRGRGDEWLRWGMLKGFMDGSLGSHTAFMEDGFTDAPSDRGLLVNPVETMAKWINGADAAGLQLAIHAIGDRANRLLLDMFQAAAKVNRPRDRRFRIEHAQHLRAADIPRFASLGVIASMQPYHAIDDGCWADRVIGPERAKGTYAFRSLLGSGARLAFGSDWFVAPPSVAQGLYAAVTRATLDGKRRSGWVPEQKITVEEALRAYTAGAAFASFEEKQKGTLEPGKLADFVVLSQDVTRMPATGLRDTKVLLTVAGGRIVWRSGL